MGLRPAVGPVMGYEGPLTSTSNPITFHTLVFETVRISPPLRTMSSQTGPQAIFPFERPFNSHTRKGWFTSSLQ
eukprot:g18570.t1